MPLWSNRREAPGGGRGFRRRRLAGVPRPPASVCRTLPADSQDPRRDTGGSSARPGRTAVHGGAAGCTGHGRRVGGGRVVCGREQPGQPERCSSAYSRRAETKERRAERLLLASREVCDRSRDGNRAGYARRRGGRTFLRQAGSSRQSFTQHLFSLIGAEAPQLLTEIGTPGGQDRDGKQGRVSRAGGPDGKRPDGNTGR